MRPIYTLFIALFLIVGTVPAYAQVQTEIEFQRQVDAIKQQIQELQDKLKEVRKSNPSISSSSRANDDDGVATSTDKSKLKLMYKLRRGASGEDVRILQKVLASDPTLYPEGFITGFFGPLTEIAVKRFQAKIKLEQVGEVGPQTLARINEILTAAGIIGDVPADLLNSRVKIKIEIKDGREEVKIEVKCDSSGSGNVCKDDSDDEDEDEDDEDDSDEDEDEDEDDTEDDD